MESHLNDGADRCRLVSLGLGLVGEFWLLSIVSFHMLLVLFKGWLGELGKCYCKLNCLGFMHVFHTLVL